MKEKEILIKIYKMVQICAAILLSILVLLVIWFSKMYLVDTSKNSDNENQYNTKYDVSMFKEIKANDIEKETKNKISVIYIGRSSCGWCAAFLPNLWQAEEEYGYETLYIDIAKIIDYKKKKISDQKSYDILLSLSGEGYEKYMEEKLGSTPMILIMKDNIIIGAQTGYCEYDVFEKVLTDAGISK